MPDKPLIIQSDRTLLLDVHALSAKECRNDILAFTELIKSPEHMHTYAMSAISLWNAASSGITSETVITRLEKWSRFPIPESVLFFIRETGGRFGKIVLELPADDTADAYDLVIPEMRFIHELLGHKQVARLLMPTEDEYRFRLHRYDRGEVKLQLVQLGFPVDDRVPLKTGEPVDITLNHSFSLREYQIKATASVIGDRGPGTGYGTLVLPCGSGKTVVGLNIMQEIKTRTLILAPNVAAVHQWIRELLEKTTLSAEMIGEYTGEKKEIKPVTVCTYQVLTWRPDKTGDFPHLRLVREGNWGLIIYDEVHMLPAPVFKVTAELQAIHRVGLTATLIREDGREGEVFSLVGPKRYDVPWKELEQQGWIAEARCIELRMPLPQTLELGYALASKREKYRIASENPIKIDAITMLLERHKCEHILIIGQYIDQLKEISSTFNIPLITGSTANKKRDELYEQFRQGHVKILAVSKVANFAIDLPDASVAIQVSGTFGSRQEEAQRLGRIVRPKADGSWFYSLVTTQTAEEEFAANRQKFLTEQGYSYSIEVWT